MLLGVVARSFRRIAAAAGFEFQTGLGSPTARVDYQGSASAYAIDTALGSPFGAQGYQVGSDAYAFDTALGTPTAITGKSGSAEAFAIVTGMGEPTATVAYQGDPADIEVVTEVPTIAAGYTYTNTEAQTFEDNADTTGWDDDLRGDIDQLFSDLKSGQVNSTNVLAELDMLYLHDLPNSADALRCLIDPTRTATAVNSPTFTANQGFTGNGSTSYINTNYAPTDGTNWALNSASMGAWVRTAASAGTRGLIASSDSNAYAYLASDNNQIEFANLNSISATWLTASFPTGLLAVNRSGASAQQVYADGVSRNSNTLSSGSFVSSRDLYVLCINSNGSASSFSDAQVSASFAGGSLTANQHADLYDALNRYRTAREAA